MKALFLLLFALTISVSQAQTIAQLDAKNGFKHYKFGTSSKSYSNLKAIKTRNSRRKGESNYASETVFADIKNDQLGDLKVEFVDFHFYKDQLEFVEIGIPLDALNDIRWSLIDLYGQPIKKVGYDQAQHYYWTGKKAQAEFIVYTWSPIKPQCTLIYRSLDSRFESDRMQESLDIYNKKLKVNTSSKRDL